MKKKARLQLFILLALASLLLPIISVPEVHATASTVTTSTSTNMIRYPNQRKTFYDRGRYWVFYQNNTAPTRIYYTTSLDGITWETPTLLTSNIVDVGFAVWLDEATHDISYVATFGTLRYRKGNLQPDGTIVWYDSEQTVPYPWISDNWYLRDSDTGLAGTIYDAVNGTYGSANYTTEVVVGTASIGDLFYIDPYANTTSSLGTTEPGAIISKGWRTSQFTKTYSHGGWTPNIRLQVRYTNTFKGRVGIRIWNDTNADLSTATVLKDWTWLNERTYTTSGEEITTNQEIYLPDLTMTNEYMYFEFIFNVTQAGTNADAGFFLRGNDIYARVRANALNQWSSPSYFNIVTDTSDYPYIIAVNYNGFNNTVQVASGSLTNGSWGTTTWVELLEVPYNSNYNTVLAQLGSNKLMAMYQTGYNPIHTRLYDGVSSWASEVNVTNTYLDNPFYKEQWATSSNGSTIHLVYNNQTAGVNGVLRYSNWTEGSGWLTPEAIGGDAVGTKSPSVTLSQNGTLYATWANSTTIMYKRRNPSGGAWDSSVTVLETDSGIQPLLGVQTSFSDYGNRMTVAWTTWTGGGGGYYSVRFSYLPIAPYSFTFYGPYDETTGELIMENVTQQYYEDSPNIVRSIYAQYWEAQTITPQESHDVLFIELLLFRSGSPGQVVLSLRNTTASRPSGADLANSTIDGDSLTTNTNGLWYGFRFNQSYSLVAGVEYAMVIRAPSGSSGNTVNVLAVNPGGYPRGGIVNSGNSGSTWGTPDLTGYDWVFKEISQGVGVTVTAYFTDGTEPEEFVVRETYVFAGRPETHKPEYFSFGISEERQYWLGDDESSGDIYIFDDTLTEYVIEFLDLGGVLNDYSFISAQYYVNGTLRTVEKRKADEENKIHMNLVNGRKYNLVIIDGSSYTFGDLLMTSDTTVLLTIKGLEFPDHILLGYQYVRIWPTRNMTSGTELTINYQDLLNETTQVFVGLYFLNNTQAWNTTQTTDSFVVTWNGMNNETDYYASGTITHTTFGVMSFSNPLPGLLSSSNPFSLDILGTLPFDTAYLIPAFFMLCVAGVFSALNVPAGLFSTIVLAILFGYLGWLPIHIDVLIFVFALVIIFAIARGRRHVIV